MTWRNKVGGLALVVGGLTLAAGTGIGILNQYSKPNGEGDMSGHTSFSIAADVLLDGDIDRTRYCSQKYGPESDNPRIYCNDTTVRYDGDNALGTMAAYAPRGTDLLAGALLSVLGLGLLGYKPEDNPAPPVNRGKAT